MDQRSGAAVRASAQQPASATRAGGDGGPAGRVAPQPPGRQETYYSGYEERGYGWVMFAGTMIAIVGIVNVIYGIAAVSNSKFYAGNVTYIISDLNTWGWVIMFTGVVQFLAAFGIFMRSQWARWVGVATAGVNAIIQLIFIPSYPLASLAIFAIDILVLYGLLAYGGRERASA